MNKAGQYTSELPDDEALALDYALGILVEPDLSLALKRVDDDARFALLVWKYRARLMSESIEHAAVGDIAAMPRLETWQAILARITGIEQP